MVSQSETPPTGQGGISTKKLVFLPVELRKQDPPVGFVGGIICIRGLGKPNTQTITKVY